MQRLKIFFVGLAAALLLAVSGCNQAATAPDTILVLPAFTPPGEANRPLRVVATTSIIGDVVAQVGGGAIELTTLMAPGQDPHAYEASAQDLLAVAAADVVFVHGWNLEEGLATDLPEIAAGPIVPVAAGIEPRRLEGGDEHDWRQIDPHTWLDPQLVSQWVSNIETSLRRLDPDRAAAYAANAAAYQAELTALDQALAAAAAALPAGRRVLVTNHDSLGYFADRYGFTVIGTVIPNLSTMAEPSANELSALVAVMREYGVCAIFSDTGANTRLAETVARELAGDCPEVAVLPLYTGALGPAGSGAETYLTLMTSNMAVIRRGLSGNLDTSS